MSEKETMIRLEGIKKRFRTKAGELEVLHGVSADIKKGEVFGIIGLSRQKHAGSLHQPSGTPHSR